MTTVNEIQPVTFLFRDYAFHDEKEAFFFAGCDECVLKFDSKIAVIDKENAEKLAQEIQAWLHREGN